MLVHLGEAPLIVRVLTGNVRYRLLLLLTPQNHSVFKLERLVISIFGGLETLEDRVLVGFILVVNL